MEDSRGKSPAFEVVRNIALGIQLCNGNAYKLFSLVVFNPRNNNGYFKFILKIFFSFFYSFLHMVGNCLVYQDTLKCQIWHLFCIFFFP